MTVTLTPVLKSSCLYFSFHMPDKTEHDFSSFAFPSFTHLILEAQKMSVLSPTTCSTLLRATAISHSFIISFRNSHSPVPVCFDSPLILFFHFTKEKNSLVFPLASFASAATITSSSFLSTLYSFKTTGWSPSLPFLLPFTFLIQM